MKKAAFAVALLALGVRTAAAQDAQSAACAAPGEIVVEDLGGDSAGNVDWGDIEFLGMSEPAALPGKLVFTLKVRALPQTPPVMRWAVEFLAPQAVPAGHSTWFVMMTTERAPIPEFVYGTTQVLPQDGLPTGFKAFNISGALAEGSAFAADGTVTLVLDKAVIGNPAPGQSLDNLFPIVRTITTPGGTVFDQGSNGYYELVADGVCGDGKSGSGLIAAGAFAPFGLLLLALGARRRRH